MNELLKTLLEQAGILTDESKQQITEAFDQHIEKIAEDVRVEVTAQLNEQWVAERETLIEAIDVKVTAALAEEIEELKHDIENFRDLEVEAAEKLTEAKRELAEKCNTDIEKLVEALDTFVEIRMASEIAELKEDIEVAKRNKFGRAVFEAFIHEFRNNYVAEDSVEGQLIETEARLEDALVALEESERVAAELLRDKELSKVLAPLSGTQREVMEAILKTVDTQMLQEAYDTYIGRVLTEGSSNARTKKINGLLEQLNGKARGLMEAALQDVDTDQLDEAYDAAIETVLAESKTSGKEGKKVLTEGVVKTGDNVDLIRERLNEGKFEQVSDDSRLNEIARLRRLAGI